MGTERKKAARVGRGKTLNATLGLYWIELRRYAEKHPKTTLAALLAAAYAFVTGVGKLVVIFYLGRIGVLPFDADLNQYSNQLFVIGLTVCLLLLALVPYFGYAGCIPSMFIEENRTLRSLFYPSGRRTTVKKFRKKIFLLFGPLAAATLSFNFHLWAKLDPSQAWHFNQMDQLAVIFAGLSICLSCCSAYEVYAVKKSLKDAGAYIACLVASFIFFGIPALLLYALALGTDRPVNLFEMLAAHMLVLFLNMAVHRSLTTAGQITDCVKAGAGSIFLTFLMLGLWQVFPKGVMRVYGMGNVNGVTLTLSRQGRGVLDAAGVPVQCDQAGDNCTARDLDLLLKTRNVYYLSYTAEGGRVKRFEVPASAGTVIVSADGVGVETAGSEVGKR